MADSGVYEGTSHVPPVTGGGPVADPRPLARATVVLIAAQAVTQLGIALAGGTRSTLFARTVPVSMALFLATTIVFLCWFRRCRLNAEVFAPGSHRYAQGFAVGAWFIPVAMWWIPRRVALDIRRASRPDGSTWLINAWWAAWLAKTVGGALTARFAAHADGYALRDALIGLLAAVLAILVVRQITADQLAGWRPVSAAPPAASATTE